jgi:NADH-quinone oxidoreductase subunit L
MWLIPALPLLSAAILLFFGRHYIKDLSHWPCILSIAASAFLSINVLLQVNGESPPATSHDYFKFIDVGPEKRSADAPTVDVPFSLRADPLSSIMLVTVTFIGSLIAIFAAGYMAGDPGYPRFFAEVSLFIAAMTLLVSGNNLIMLFIGWEGVGLCSYLLIGFWFAKPSAAAAARKAFLVNRIGDFGFILGIMAAWVVSGFYVDYDNVFVRLQDHPEWATVICLLLFCGAMGKSAQVPLHVWLPDAMEGPTPVSALIHAATMVTAGVYLVARCTPLFADSPTAQVVVACVGGFTALFAALIGLTQTDLKRVLAYSTLSQLGYMFLALGCAVKSANIITFAVVAAIFHLFTHAFFKALLFLSAGSVMHAMGGIDMRRFSGLRAVMPVTHLTFLCGAVALAGLPIFSGFWSKDEILAAAFSASQEASDYNGIYALLFMSAVFTAGLTAFYTFRAYFKTFCGKLVIPPEAGSHGHGGHDDAHGHGHAPAKPHGEPKQGEAHESPPLMTVPLMILAVFALFVGLLVGPSHIFAHPFEKVFYSAKINGVERTITLEGKPVHKSEGKTGHNAGEGHEHETNYAVMLGSTAFVLVGLFLAWIMYIKNPEMPGKLAASVQGLYQLSLNKFHVDELYDSLILKPILGFAEFCRIFDAQVVDGIVDSVGEFPRLVGALFRPVQNGLLQFYALAMMLGLTVFLIALARSL